MAIKLAELAKLTGCELHGDGDCAISSVADIARAGEGDIAFISDLKYRKYLADTSASALILTEDLLAESQRPTLVSKSPRLTYARIANLLFPAESWNPGISDRAVIAESASLGADVYIAPGAVLEAGVVIGDGACIGPNTVIEHDAVIGARTVLRANVTIGHHCETGEACLLHSGCVLGADGFGFVRDNSDGKTENIKIPQTGRVLLGDDVEIGACTTIDRGALDDTVIENGVKLDNQIQVGHSVSIGANTIISAATAIAGSTRIGADCMIGGCAAIREHIEIADRVMITARTMVTHSVTREGASVSSSTPMDDTVSWRKNSVRFRQLDKMARQIKALEKQLAQLDKQK